ncbi:hypothetical protein ACIF6L_31895 [Kitasatospora sp. NPDC086009]|uniref:hypothetical protein n=1 Tax=unclassified Kitasatospora TaxID=2633591 RepID=UPI0037C55CC6
MSLAAAPLPELAADRRERLADLLAATSPATRARQAQATVLPVLEPLRRLLPHGGLAKGTITEATDTSLLLALAAGPATTDPYAWTAAVGLPDLGLAAAAGYGLDLKRLLVADFPGDHYAEVVTALAAACPVVLAARPHRPGAPRPRTARRPAAPERHRPDHPPRALARRPAAAGGERGSVVGARGGARAADWPPGAGDGVGPGFGGAASRGAVVAAGRDRQGRRGGAAWGRREAASGHGGCRMGVAVVEGAPAAVVGRYGGSAAAAQELSPGPSCR